MALSMADGELGTNGIEDLVLEGIDDEDQGLSVQHEHERWKKVPLYRGRKQFIKRSNKEYYYFEYEDDEDDIDDIDSGYMEMK